MSQSQAGAQLQVKLKTEQKCLDELKAAMNSAVEYVDKHYDKCRKLQALLDGEKAQLEQERTQLHLEQHEVDQLEQEVMQLQQKGGGLFCCAAPPRPIEGDVVIPRDAH
mmetsp:Transcript_57884/g.123081  ORF Transcript_57884/g.123081 Transcript_57884/m.123081 type:complete len:109 (-) Transcript_57884:49-375(-)